MKYSYFETNWAQKFKEGYQGAKYFEALTSER